jgi:hypothetical protein
LRPTTPYLLAFDNLSGLPPWLSDALCRLATGGSFAVRQLYTDDEEVLFEASRPILLNGIEDARGVSDSVRHFLYRLRTCSLKRHAREESNLLS